MGPQRAIRNLLTLTMLAAVCLTQQASAEEENKSGWGNASDLRSPHPDSKGRSGHWWWPEYSDDRPKEADHVGNRGRVFGNWEASEASVSHNTPAPPEPPDWVPGQIISCGPSILLNNIIFPSDSVALSEYGKAEADKLIGEMFKFPNDTVVCVGHTDDVGSENYNLQLGLRRAQAVVNYMTAAGISPERLRAESKGEAQPAVRNDTPTNRALNRRVVFEVTLRN